MRRRTLLLSIAATLVLVAATLAETSVSSAATTAADLAISGSTVAGVTSTGELGHELAFAFTLKNKSTTTTVDVAFVFTITHGTADGSDYICALSNHVAINPDTPNCEPGTLGPGRTAQAAILATQTGRPMTVRACADNLSGTDPVASNNCKTLVVR